MPNLPTGTVTFLFTDIEGSTRLLQQLGDAYADVLADCRRLVRTAVQERGGQEVDTEGDAVFAAFSSAREALMAAVTSQQGITRHPWPDGVAVRVRMGLHTGEARVAEAGYVGMDVHRAARICAAAHGGQILLSDTISALVTKDLPSGVSLRDLGEHRLKDLAHPHHLFQVVTADLPTDFPPLQSLDAHPHNLPIQLTSFIGRTQEIVEVKRLLGAARLVTLTGSGGAGKTRLALQVAADVVQGYPDGVWLTELAPIGDPALIPKTVASALNVPEQPGREMTDTLVDALRSKALLLVFDNCEHLLSTCANVAAALLQACPQLRILATSRERLGVPGETLWRVPSLSLPDARRLPPPEDLVLYEAVRLFVDRAVASEPQFAVTSRNAPAVAQVCQRLDGIPLAIELAAARVKVLAVEQIAARLEDRFRLLTGGSRTALPRQQTLRAAMDWSYALLPEQERAVLRRLSVFAGGWMLEAAEAVCVGEDVNSSEILDLLTQLVDKSLVLGEMQRGEARYRLLETVRDYARDRMLETSEGIEAKRRHRDWFLGLAETADLHFGGREEELWLEKLEIEHDNFRTALEWSMTVGGDTEAALRLAGGLGPLWYVRGHYSEGIRWLERALSLKGYASPAARRRALGTGGWLAAILGQRERAVELSEEALLLAREAGDKSSIGHCLVRLGYCALVQGEFDKSETLILEGLALLREVGDNSGIAQALNALGEAARSRGDYEAARTFYQDSVAIKREIGDRRGIAMTVVNLGFMALHQGDYRAGASSFREALGLNRNLGYKKGITTSIAGLAGVALEEGRPKRAARLLGAANVMLEAISGHFDPPDQVDYDRFLSTARATLGEAAFEETWSEGGAMTLEQAIEYALTSKPSDLESRA